MCATGRFISGSIPPQRELARANAPLLAQLGARGPAVLGHPADILCDRGQWGPEAAGGADLYAILATRFAFTWYDDVMIELERVR